MYQEFLDALLIYIRALNDAETKVMPTLVEGMTPYLGRIPVLLEDCLCGWLVDEIGGVWSYQDATREEVDFYVALKQQQQQQRSATR